MIHTSKNGDLMAFHDDLMGFRLILSRRTMGYSMG